MERIDMRRRAAGWLLCTALAACGGGGGEAPGPIEAPAAFSLAVQGTSASTAALRWQGGADVDGTRYRIERRLGSEGAFAALAEVSAGQHLFLDRGLEAQSTYTYRVFRLDPAEQLIAEGTAQTGADAPLAVEPGAFVGSATAGGVSQAASTLASDDGAIEIDLPADAQRAAGTASVQRLTNTLPDGRGDGVEVVLPSRPTAPFTVRMKLAEADADDAQAQRLAVRQQDGSWLLLPSATLDAQARVFTAIVPTAVLGADTPARKAGAAAAPSAPAGPAKVVLSRLVAIKLEPAQASVRVGGTLHFLPHAVYTATVNAPDDCLPEEELCVPQPMLVRRSLQLRNHKPGYERLWKVDGVPGGDAVHGTLAPADPAGATYTAPPGRPDPSTVTVSFTSRHLASGRSLTLKARVRIQDDAWAGPMHFQVTADGGGAGYFYKADTRWVLDADASTPLRRVYRAQGHIELEIRGACSVTASPSRMPLGPELGLSELVVDESRQPATYALQLHTHWQGSWSTSCGGEPVPTGFGAIWNQTGELGDGRIAGTHEAPPASRSWQLTRPD